MEEALASHISSHHSSEIPKHNASLAVQLVEAAMNRLAARLAGGGGEEARGKELVVSDFGIPPSASSDDRLASAAALLSSLPSELSAAKAHLTSLHHTLLFLSQGGGGEAGLRGATRLALLTPLGTDHDRVVDVFSSLLSAHRVVSGEVVRRSALSLLGEKGGGVSAKLDDMLEAASGGMLVLRDAGALVQAGEVRRVVAGRVGCVPPSTSLVLMGEPAEMAVLLESTPELAACFSSQVTLPDLTPGEVLRDPPSLLLPIHPSSSYHSSHPPPMKLHLLHPTDPYRPQVSQFSPLAH